MVLEPTWQRGVVGIAVVPVVTDVVGIVPAKVGQFGRVRSVSQVIGLGAAVYSYSEDVVHNSENSILLAIGFCTGRNQGIGGTTRLHFGGGNAFVMRILGIAVPANTLVKCMIRKNPLRFCHSLAF